ncbi:MAG: hypothetical protein ABSG53_20795 [Thermoguttaceae bacterium]
MKIQQFLEHHGLVSNPFADEDAQTDLVFKGACIRSVFHPAWDKIYGDPTEPATSVVFGEKGSGKTAMRLQVVRRLADYNADHPDRQVFVVQYDDFNPFIDRFREGFHGRWRRIDRALGQWRLWDHIDAILSLAVTQLVDRILEVQQVRHPAARDEPLRIDKLNASQARDVALLAAIYDQSTAENPAVRWQRLRKKLRFSTWTSKWDLAVGGAVSGIGVAAMALSVHHFGWSKIGSFWPWILVAIVAGWLPWLGRFLKWTWKAWQIGRNTRVLNHAIRPLRKILLNFPAAQLVGQPLPVAQQTDHRYQLLEKLQSALRSLGFDGIVAIVDRVDEPYLINGSSDLMKALVWPMLDNKFLKHPGLGLKLLLPVELERMIDRQERDFHERARLDKQNLIRSLAWTGQSLYDLANARLKACAADGKAPTIAELLDPAIDSRRLKDGLGTLRVPRHLFKFMYRLFTTHCNAYSDDNPAWKIGQAEFESVLALYQRDQDALDRGVGAG